MTSGITVDIDTSGMNRAMRSVHEALIGQGRNGDAATLVQDETRRLALQVVRFTPPYKGASATGFDGTARQVGEEAVRRNLVSLFGEAEPDLIDKIGSENGIANIDTWITGKDEKPIRLRWDNLDPTGDRIFERHQQYRNKKGRVTKGFKGAEGEWRKRVIIPKGTLQPYIKRTQKRVGRWKATWAFVAHRLGARVPAWISRHFGKLGSLAVADIEGLKQISRPSVIFGSRAPGNSRIQQRVRDAMRTRMKAMERRAKLIISGYNKDLARGMKAQRRAAATEAA